MGKGNFSDDFKRDAVAQITERGYPVSEVIDPGDIDRPYAHRLGNDVARLVEILLAIGLGHQVGDFEPCGFYLLRPKTGIDQERAHRSAVRLDLGLHCLQRIAGGGIPDRPVCEIGPHLFLGQAFDNHRAVGYSRGDHPLPEQVSASSRAAAKQECSQ
jgi:hypothetical protein